MNVMFVCCPVDVVKHMFVGHDKHSNSRGGNSSVSSNKEHVRESATSSRHWSSGSSREDSDVSTSKEPRMSRKQSEENTIQTTQDMDISPGDSTPTSEVSYGGNNSSTLTSNEQNTTMGPVLLANALPRLISHPIHVPSTPVSTENSTSIIDCLSLRDHVSNDFQIVKKLLRLLVTKCLSVEMSCSILFGLKQFFMQNK